MSCPGDRRLKDGKCQTRLTIRFRFTLDFDFVSFLENENTQVLIEKIAEILNIDLDLIDIDELIEGSVEAGGSISTTEDTSSGMAETLTANTGNLGFPVLSSSVDIYYDDGVYNSGETPVVAEDNLGLIIGASVGGVVLIAIIVLVIYKCKNKGS